LAGLFVERDSLAVDHVEDDLTSDDEVVPAQTRLRAALALPVCIEDRNGRGKAAGAGLVFLLVAGHVPAWHLKADTAADELDEVGILRPPGFTGGGLDEQHDLGALCPLLAAVVDNGLHPGDGVALAIRAGAGVGRVGVGCAPQPAQVVGQLLGEGVVFGVVVVRHQGVAVVGEHVEHHRPDGGGKLVEQAPGQRLGGLPLVANLLELVVRLDLQFGQRLGVVVHRCLFVEI